MRTTAITLALTVLLLAGASGASETISKADLYYQLYAQTLDSARQAAEQGYWDLYNDLYQKAQYYRREYEFYRSAPVEPLVVVAPARVVPTVTYQTYTYVSPPVYYVPPTPIYYYTPAPTFGFRLRIGDFDRRPRFDDHRSWNVGRDRDSHGRDRDSHDRGADPRGRDSGGHRR
ncbi:MAG: hypothetical protein V2A58_04380 [Planctomycetota bacterium]